MADTPSIDLKQLRCFVGVVDAGSLTRAARVLRIAQPALSNRVAALESQLGVRLLHRTSTGVTPTREGEVFYGAAQRILRDLQAVAEEVRQMGQTLVGLVRFGCSQATSNILTKPLIEAVLQKLPSVRFSFYSGASEDIYHRILKGDLDLGLIFKMDETPGLSCEALVEEHLFLAISKSDPRFEERTEVSAQEIAQIGLVMASQSKTFGSHYIHQRFEEAQTSLRIIAQIDSIAGILDMIRHQHVASILPWCALRGSEDHIRWLPVKGVDLSRTLFLCRASDRPMAPAAEAIRQLSLEVVHSMIELGEWQLAKRANRHTR